MLSWILLWGISHGAVCAWGLTRHARAHRTQWPIWTWRRSRGAPTATCRYVARHCNTLPRLPWLSLELEVQPAARMLRRCCTAAAVLLVEKDGQREPCKPAHRPGAAMQVPVLYPFGHGLSYASFAYSGLAATPAANGAAQSYSITVTVTNTGKHPSC